MNQPTNGKPNIEEWELTAFALNELPADRAQVIELAIKNDSKLAEDMASFAATIGQVSDFYRMEETVASGVSSASTTVVSLASPMPTRGRPVWMELSALGAVAATFAAIGYFSYPATTVGNLSSKDNVVIGKNELRRESESFAASQESDPNDEDFMSGPTSAIVDESETRTFAHTGLTAERSGKKLLDHNNNPISEMNLSNGSLSGSGLMSSRPSGSSMPGYGGGASADSIDASSPSGYGATSNPGSGGKPDYRARAKDMSSSGGSAGGSYPGAGGPGGYKGPKAGMSANSSKGGAGVGYPGSGGTGMIEDDISSSGGSAVGGYPGSGGPELESVKEELQTLNEELNTGGYGQTAGMSVNSSKGGTGVGYPGAGGAGMMGGASPRDISKSTAASPSLGIAAGTDGKAIQEDDLFGSEGDTDRRYESLAKQGDRFESIIENEFQSVDASPLSTFSIDVDTASYSKMRQYLTAGMLPQPATVRIEEMINYFQYHYQGPTGDVPFSSALAVAQCPWQAKHQLVRIALQAKKIDMEKRPLSNLVFLLDVSGSMNEPNKLPLVKESMRMLIQQLSENDRVAMVVYAGAAGVVLESTRGDKQTEILSALDRLQAGGSTNGGAGIQAAYNIAREHFIPGGTNRVILCSDGDFNVGVTSNEELVALVEENAKSKVFLTVLGFGIGNTNDSMMEKITNRGNGMYGFVDNLTEARRMMVEQLAGSLITVAKDVKIQVEFNPLKVASYRLIGYENRVLAAQDFNNDKKDAGEIGAGHNVTALYEIVPTEGQEKPEIPAVDRSRYRSEKEMLPAANSDELLVVKLRYKQPEGDTSSLLEFPLVDTKKQIKDCDSDFLWAASVAQFGMMLRGSKFQGVSSWDALIETADAVVREGTDPYRAEAVELMRAAKKLKERG